MHVICLLYLPVTCAVLVAINFNLPIYCNMHVVLTCTTHDYNMLQACSDKHARANMHVTCTSVGKVQPREQNFKITILG